MISTVTTSTVSTITTAALAGSVALIGIFVLLALLLQKELISALEGTRYQKWASALNIGIIPLMIAFALIVVSRVAEVLQ